MLTPEGKVKLAIKRKLTAWKKDGIAIWWFWPQSGIYGKSGVPDLILCVEGQFLAFEVKAHGNTPTEKQAVTLDDIGSAGGEATWVDNVEEFETLCRPYLEKTR